MDDSVRAVARGAPAACRCGVPPRRAHRCSAARGHACDCASADAGFDSTRAGAGSRRASRCRAAGWRERTRAPVYAPDEGSGDRSAPPRPSRSANGRSCRSEGIAARARSTSARSRSAWTMPGASPPSATTLRARVDDQAVSKRRVFSGMDAARRRRKHEGRVLDRARAQQRLPVRRPRSACVKADGTASIRHPACASVR